MTQTALHRMIGAQADALDRIAGLDLDAPATLLAEARRVILVGTGTSQHAAELGAMMLDRAGADARWSAAATWARWSTGPKQGDVLLVITHTGQTGYAARARAEALASGVPVVSITGTGAGWPEAITTVAPEESETYTVSYTAALAVLARLAHLVTRAGEDFPARADPNRTNEPRIRSDAAGRIDPDIIFHFLHARDRRIRAPPRQHQVAQVKRGLAIEAAIVNAAID